MLLHFIDPGIFCAGLSCKCTVRQETKAKKKTRNNFFTLAKQKQNKVASTYYWWNVYNFKTWNEEWNQPVSNDFSKIFGCHGLHHRICTARKEKAGRWLVFSLIEPNWQPAVPCQYQDWGMPGLRAGSPIAVYTQVQCQEPKTGQQKVQFYCEDD